MMVIHRNPSMPLALHGLFRGAFKGLLLLLAAALSPKLAAQQLEAEAWTTQTGLQTEATSDAGGGLNVGWIDANDWAEYLNRPLAAGNWMIDARMATMATGRSIQLYVDDVLKTTVTYAGNTAGWQNWITVASPQFNVAAGGNHKVRLVFPGNNMNLNWIKFVPQTVDGIAPSVPTGLNSPSQSNTTVNLSWTGSTDNVGVTGYDVYKGGVLSASLGNVVAYQAGGLTANTAYSFQVRARDAAGNASALSGALNVSTTNTATANLLVNGDFSNAFANWNMYQGVPLNVSGEYAVNVPVAGNVYDVNLVQILPLTQGGKYTLTFRARSNANRTIVGGWGLAEAPWTNQSITVNLTTAWTDYVLSAVSTVPSLANSRVFFDVGGMTGEVHIDNVVLAKETIADVQAPSVPAGLASPAQANTTINLAWTGSTDNVGVTGYDVYKGGVLLASLGNVTVYQATGLAANTAYSFQVLAKDAAGNKSALSPAVNVTTANGQTALLIEAEAWTLQNGLQTEATTDVGGGLNVGWIDALDWAEYANQPLAAGTYRLEARIATMDVNRSIQLSVDGALLTTLGYAGNTGGWQTWATAVSGNFTVPASGNHLIRIGFPGNNMNLNWIRLVPTAPDLQAPTLPANVASPAQTGTTADLTWTASTDNVAVAGYEIHVNGILKSVVGPVTASQITGLALQTTYSVRILAFDAAGNKSALTAAINVTTTNAANLNGIYAVTNRNSSKCVEVSGGSVANGAVVIQNECDGSRAQKWELTLAGANVYKLKNVNSGKVLDVTGAGSTNDVQQWDDVNGAAQQWRVLPAATGYFTLNATSDVSECLDIFGVSKANGATLQTYGCNGLASQQFALAPTEATTACVAGAPASAAIATQELWPGVGFTQPMELVQEPAAAGNAWIVMDKLGMIRRVLDDAADNVNRVFLNMEAKVTNSGESGLASFAFDPEYGVSNRYVYLTYLSSAPQELRLSRFTANANGTAVDPAIPEVVLFRFAQASDIHHSGGLAFGPGPVAGANYLYLSVGDNGTNATGDLTPLKVTQMNWPNGKILRFSQAEFRSAAQLPWNYANGATNPYIVATGLRNPWRLSFDGDDMWISNVGFDKNEEINKFNVKTEIGVNFGWPWCEGNTCCTAGIDCSLGGQLPPMPNNLTPPFYAYPRSDGPTGEGAVIGGFVYRGTAMPGLAGKYIFTDFVDQEVYSLDPATKVRTRILSNAGNIADIGKDRNGEIMLTDYGRSNIYRIVPGAGGPLLAWPPQNLADAGCFESLNNGNPVPKASVRRFNVAQKFWSDGADKERMVSLPAGSTINVTDPDNWTLPIGGVTIKNFFWQGSIFETRLFVRHTDATYAGYTYKWTAPNAATLVSADGDTKDLGGGMIWKYPSRSQCMTCHNEKVGGSIALETRQMNVGSQLADMAHQGMFNIANPAPLAPFPDFKDWTVPIGDRANAYMHVNCANCHRGPAESAAGRATWDARYNTPLANKKACDETPIEPVGGSADERIIKPGNHTLSTVWLRAHQRTSQYMPPLGSSVPDAEGVDMLRDWMNQLTGCQ
ncbi:MAG: hypothetical protein JWP91_2053 [Fibrobacteres bacterium]|nr:hypothetical protein [Fibrobacterota bacterium]